MNASRISSFSQVGVLLLAFLLLAGISDLKAQYFNFGKNRVQYDSFDWKYIQSEHFDVYYYTSQNYDLAYFTAISLEASIRQVQEDFQHRVADRIQVIVYDSHNDFTQTNVVPLPVNAEGIGGVTDLYKNRITMPFNGNFMDYRNVLQHELVHAVINDMFYGGTIQSLIGGRSQLILPDWFDEGLAEYVSVGWDTNSDMFIRDAMLNNYLPPIPQLGGYFAYRGGQSLWNFIVERYGRAKIGEILQAARSQRSLSAAFRRALGMDIEELNDQWQEYYRKIYFPEVAQREDIDNFADLLTERGTAGTYNTSPAISPQGDKVAMLSNSRGYFDVMVISAVTGEVLKTVIKGQDNVMFEELNILNPNLTWSPDGTRLALSAKSKGDDQLAIVDYNSGKVRFIAFPELDAIGSVAWSPDGQKIAMDGNIGSLQDIFVYNLESGDFTNLTNDVISDREPAWGSDSETIYFTSSRGDNTELGQVNISANMLDHEYFYTTDIYSVRLGSSRAQRLTKTPGWDEYQPETTQDGRLIYISEQNGIPNVVQMNLDDRTTVPLTNLLTGVLQMSVSSDGSRMAVSSINEGYTDIFLVRAPFERRKEGVLADNHWAERRAVESPGERVPALAYSRQMIREGNGENIMEGLPVLVGVTQDTAGARTGAAADTSDTTDSDRIDFRNYVFDSAVSSDSAFAREYLNRGTFEPDDNTTDDGRYRPQDYRLRFTTDVVYASGGFSTYYGSYGLTQLMFSDLLGDHQVVFGSNLVTDLRNSNYYLQYGNYKNRTNWLFSFFHSANSFQGFSGQVYRFRNYGGGITSSYPIDRFRRIDFSLSAIGLDQDFSVVGRNDPVQESSAFLYPQAIYTRDNTLPGFLTPMGGSRYAISLTGSPPVTANTLEFVSLLGDYRKYFNLGYGYSFGLRAAGAASYGEDSQTFFMGGMMGWINQRFNRDTPLPLDKLGDTFITLPALPLRGHEYNSIYGDHFSLVNAEFRFPLFAAILPGPIPFLPLYNMTGIAFIDAGAAWGQDISFEAPLSDGTQLNYFTNSSDFDFRVQERGSRYYDNTTGQVLEERPPDFEGGNYAELPYRDGDLLIGTGFGIHTIIFGLPLRYDVGWPYYADGFGSRPIHYFSLGIDF